MRENMWSTIYMVMAIIITIDIMNNAAGQSNPIRTGENHIGKNQNFNYISKIMHNEKLDIFIYNDPNNTI